jgi:hypothetical protein
MPKQKPLKVIGANPRLWLQRRYAPLGGRNPLPKGWAVIPEEREQREQPPRAGTKAPGWVREARLRSQFAAEYPGIVPGVWMPVGELSAKLIDRVRAARKEGRHTRTFDPTHFEFRGGSQTPRPRASRTRSTDPRL